MRMIVSLLLVGVFGLSGCSMHGGLSSERERETFEARQTRYQKLAPESTPDAWRAGAEWEFATTGKDGAIAESFVVRVTDAPQDACLSGDWRKLEIVSGNTGKLRAPAYVIDGRNLQVLLSTELCECVPDVRRRAFRRWIHGHARLDPYARRRGIREGVRAAGSPIALAVCPLLAESGRSAGTPGSRAANVRFRPIADIGTWMRRRPFVPRRSSRSTV